MSPSAETSSGIGENEDRSLDEDFLVIGEILIARAYLYLLWHKLLSTAPDQAVMDQLLSEASHEVLQLFAEENDTLGALDTHLSHMSQVEDPSGHLRMIRGEYTRLFIGPEEPVALPYASPYKTHDHAVVQENTVDVRNWYRSQGVEPRLLLRIPDDHIAILCAFCARQAELMAQAFLGGNEQRFKDLLVDSLQFIPEHLASWIDDYAFRMRAAQTAYLYPQLIEALASFVHEDEGSLAQIGSWFQQIPAEMFGSLATKAADRAQDGLRASLDALWDVKALNPVGCEDCELRELA